MTFKLIVIKAISLGILGNLFVGDNLRGYPRDGNWVILFGGNTFIFTEEQFTEHLQEVWE